MVTFNSNTDPSHDSHTPLCPDTAVKAHCKPLLWWHCLSLWSVSPHLSTESQAGDLLPYSSSTLFSFLHSANPTKAKLSSLPSAQNALPERAFLSPPVLHTSYPSQPGTYPGRQYWTFQKPTGSLPMPLLLLTAFGFA